MEGIQVSAYSVGSSGNIVLVQVGGYIDNVTSRQLELAVDDVISQDVVRLIIDLASVSYISSAGWGVFLGKIKGLREKGGDLVITQMIPDVSDVFELLEFHRVLKSFETSEQAISHFDGGQMEKLEERSRAGMGGPGLLERGGTGRIDVEDGAVQNADLLSPRASLREQSGRPEKASKLPYAGSLLSMTEEDDSLTGSVTGEDEEIIRREPVESSKQNLPVASFYDSLGMSMTVMDRELPLNEKIKLLVIDNPLSGLWKIKNALNSSRFGYTRVGIFEVRKILKELDLDTKEKRYRFWRSR